jgi:hypothetical protein
MCDISKEVRQLQRKMPPDSFLPLSLLPRSAESVSGVSSEITVKAHRKQVTMASAVGPARKEIRLV